MDWEKLKEEKETKEEVKQDISFKSLDEAEAKRGLKIGIYGGFSTGKTHFALTCPEPIYIIDTEMGAAPLAHQFKGKDVKILDIAEKDGSLSYEKYANAVEFLTQQENIGTIVVDSITDIWDFSQEYGKVKVFKIKPEQRLAQQWDWGVINKLYLKPLLSLLNINCNLILTAREQEKYSGAGNPSGVFNPHWMKKTGYWVDFVLYNTKKIDKAGNISFITSVDKSRPLKDLMNKKFENVNFEIFNKKINELKGGNDDAD